MPQGSSAWEQMLRILPLLSEQERGRLRFILTRPGAHRPADGSTVASNVVQVERGNR